MRVFIAHRSAERERQRAKGLAKWLEHNTPRRVITQFGEDWAHNGVGPAIEGWIRISHLLIAMESGVADERKPPDVQNGLIRPRPWVIHEAAFARALDIPVLWLTCKDAGIDEQLVTELAYQPRMISLADEQWARLEREDVTVSLPDLRDEVGRWGVALDGVAEHQSRPPWVNFLWAACVGIVMVAFSVAVCTAWLGLLLPALLSPSPGGRGALSDVPNVLQYCLHLWVLLVVFAAAWRVKASLGSHPAYRDPEIRAIARGSVNDVLWLTGLFFSMYLFRAAPLTHTWFPCSRYLDTELTQRCVAGWPQGGTWPDLLVYALSSASGAAFALSGLVLLRLYARWQYTTGLGSWGQATSWLYAVLGSTMFVACASARATLGTVRPDPANLKEVMAFVLGNTPSDLMFFIALALIAGRLHSRLMALGGYQVIPIFLYAALQPVSTWAMVYRVNDGWIGLLALLLKVWLIGAILWAIAEGNVAWYLHFTLVRASDVRDRFQHDFLAWRSAMIRGEPHWRHPAEASGGSSRAMSGPSRSA